MDLKRLNIAYKCTCGQELTIGAPENAVFGGTIGQQMALWDQARRCKRNGTRLVQLPPDEGSVCPHCGAAVWYVWNAAVGQYAEALEELGGAR
jgi:hypothetical protein